MRKLTVAASLATLAVAAAPAAHAADASIGGVVTTICEISNLGPTFTNFTAMTVGQFVEDTDILIRCNSPGGMEVSMESLGGGLSSGGQIVNYEASLEGLGASIVELYINTSETASDTQAVPAEDGLALSGDPFFLTVTLLDDAIYSGTYNDTLRVELNPQ